MRHSISGDGGDAWRIRGVSRLLGVTLSLLFFGPPASAQLNLGRILGAVTDQTGGAMAGATVTVLDVARGVSRSLTADSAGEYSASSLTPGMYTVRAEAKGFKAIERQNILLEVGQDLRVDLTLQPGEQTQTVTVTESLPLVQTTNAEVSTTIENQQLNELPLSGRLYTKLLDYTPGMAGRPGGNTPTYATNGTRSQAQDWMIDGVDDFNPFAGSGPLVGANTGNDEVTILPLDAIQEVNVIENPKAEFGWKQGAQVNVGLKSGTNDIHGTAYAFGRDTSLDAQNPYLGTGFPRADDIYELFGASIGGPIKKDKLFYFANYEGLRFTIGSPGTIQMPYSAASASGTDMNFSLTDAITDLQKNVVAPSQLSLNLAGCTLTPAVSCNSSLGVFNNGTNSSNLPFSNDNIGGSNNILGKIDYHLNDKNSINGEYFFGNANDNSASGPQPYWTIGTHNRVQFVRAVWVYTPNSNWVNEARFGYDRYNLVDAPAECTQSLGQPNYATAFGFVSGAGFPSPVCGFPSVNFANLTTLGSNGGNGIQVVYDDTRSFVDSVSYTRGKHLFKFGGEFHNTYYTGYGTPANALGTINFNGGAAFGSSTPLEDFLAGAVAPTGNGILVGVSQPRLTMNRYGWFAQDDWRVMPKVIVNLGLRYEYEPAIRDANNRIGNFDPNSPTGLVQQTNGQALYSVSNDEFSPRLGVAWDVTGKGTTVVRAGGSILYDTIPLDDMIGTQGANLGVIPTGFTLLGQPGGAVTPPSSGIAVGQVSLAGNQLSWVCNNTSKNCPGAPATVTPVFNTSTSALACGNFLTPFAGAASDPAPCALAVKDPHFPNSYVSEWTVAIQHAFTNNIALNVAYVGNHGTHLPLMVDINQATPGVAASGKNQAAELQRRPYTENCPTSVPGGQGLNPNECFPYLGQINQYSPIGISNYNALQITLTQRDFHGLTLRGGYTYARCMDQWGSDNNAFVENAANPQIDYANCDTTPFQHFFLNVTYLIPGIKTPGQLLEGWEVNSNVNLVGATPFNAVDTSSDLAGIGTGKTLRGTYWTLYGDPSKFTPGGAGPIPCYGVAGSKFGNNPACKLETSIAKMPQACVTAATAEATNASLPAGTKNATGLAALGNIGCYFENGSAIVPPAQGTFGTMRRDSLLDKPFREWDLSVTKNWKFKERLTAQFRAEFFNVLNSTEYSPPSGNPNSPATFGMAQSVPNSNNPFNGTGGPREIQLGLKLIF
jgi:carboxypeptidase family protein/TonB-dependent receptor-like protein